MKNKKGFTLIELLGVIVLLGVITAIAVPSVLAISRRIQENMYCTKVDVLENAAQMWGEDQDYEDLQTVDGTLYTEVDPETITKTTSMIKVSGLVTEGYIKNDELDKCEDIDMPCVQDPRDKSSMNDFTLKVFVKNKRVYAKLEGADPVCESK